MKKRNNKSIHSCFPEVIGIAEELYEEFQRMKFCHSTLIAVAKSNALKIKMYKEDHYLPHIHIDYLNGNNHVASYSISDGKLISGNLSSKHNKAVVQWIEAHRDTLIELWDLLQNGSSYVDKVSEIKQHRPYLAARKANRLMVQSFYSLRKNRISHERLFKSDDLALLTKSGCFKLTLDSIKRHELSFIRFNFKKEETYDR